MISKEKGWRQNWTVETPSKPSMKSEVYFKSNCQRRKMCIGWDYVKWSQEQALRQVKNWNLLKCIGKKTQNSIIKTQS